MARKTKEDTEKTIMAILDGAEKIFVERGVSKTTMADIAEAAGVSRGAVYGHFEDKIEVCTAMCARAMRGTESITSTQDGETHLQTLHRWGMNYLRLIHESSAIQNALTVIYVRCEQTPENEPLLRIKTIWEKRTTTASSRILKKAVTAGELPGELDLDLANNLILALLEGVSCTLWSTTRLGSDFWPKVERLLSAGIDSLHSSKQLRTRER